MDWIAPATVIMVRVKVSADHERNIHAMAHGFICAKGMNTFISLQISHTNYWANTKNGTRMINRSHESDFIIKFQENKDIIWRSKNDIFPACFVSPHVAYVDIEFVHVLFSLCVLKSLPCIFCKGERNVAAALSLNSCIKLSQVSLTSYGFTSLKVRQNVM